MTIWDRLAKQMVENLLMVKNLRIAKFYAANETYYGVMNDLYRGAVDLLSDCETCTEEELLQLEKKNLKEWFHEKTLSNELSRTMFAKEFKLLADENQWMDDGFLTYVSSYESVLV